MYGELYHHGILGQKWGIRRFQNPDGTLTDAGKRRASKLESKSDKYTSKASKINEKAADKRYKLSRAYSKNDKEFDKAYKLEAKYDKASQDYLKRFEAKELRKQADEAFATAESHKYKLDKKSHDIDKLEAKAELYLAKSDRLSLKADELRKADIEAGKRKAEKLAEKMQSVDNSYNESYLNKHLSDGDKEKASEISKTFNSYNDDRSSSRTTQKVDGYDLRIDIDSVRGSENTASLSTVNFLNKFDMSKSYDYIMENCYDKNLWNVKDEMTAKEFKDNMQPSAILVSPVDNHYSLSFTSKYLDTDADPFSGHSLYVVGTVDDLKAHEHHL